MTCQEILDFLMQYIEGELPVEQLTTAITLFMGFSVAISGDAPAKTGRT